MEEQSDTPRMSIKFSGELGMSLLNRIAQLERERDEAQAALRMIADGDLYNADGMRTIARKALAATEAEP